MHTVLITGGAGFIGSHLADELLASGYRVRALDCLDPQVHGPQAERPEYLDRRVELQVGDVRDASAVAAALDGVSKVVHLAARVGVGQSMYEMASYTDTNVHGTAVLLEQMLGSGVESLVVGSSMSIYGEGLYRDGDGQLVEAERDPSELRAGRWELTGEHGEALEPVPTPESKRPNLASIYALNKFDQERMCLIWGRAYGVHTVALRFFNAYGDRQALSNPYTGVLAIFGNRLLNGRSPMIFEDGRQRRDFVHVSDVARACRLALETPIAAGCALNVGSGHSISIAELADRLARVMDSDVAAEVTGEYRTGDIRHCYADIAAARSVLGFEPRVALDRGIAALAQWLSTQQPVDRVDRAREELQARSLAS